MRLVQLLIACAEAVACRDKSLASALLSELRSNALVFGSAFQRVASCFVQGLIDRLSLVQPLGAIPNFGDELEDMQKIWEIDLEFSVVKSSLEKLDLKTSISEGEALIIHKLSQKVLVLVEQDSSHNEEVMNTVSCEGPARVERHERVDQWRRRTSRAGFQAAPIKMMAQAKQWLVKNQVCDGYTDVEEKGCLAGNQKPIIAASCWKC
ncbi:hypothetical protein OIU76_000463 [Salix suchowensis]|nr:hypothetical protein OIU76_000463 [Salix suchowensis]